MPFKVLIVESRQVVDDYSSKLGLPQSLEAVESIDADHRQMARCRDKADPQYRAIVGVLQHFINRMAVNGTLQEQPSIPTSFRSSKTAEVGHRLNEAPICWYRKKSTRQVSNC